MLVSHLDTLLLAELYLLLNMNTDLSILVTDPKYQRRGAASMLVRWGCEEADKRGMVANLMATQAGLSLYLKHGFRVVSETPLDLRPFGVDETELRRGMVRPAKVKCES